MIQQGYWFCGLYDVFLFVIVCNYENLMEQMSERVIEMAVPALKQLHFHRTIHEGGLSGAIGKTEELLAFISQDDLTTANRAADEDGVYGEIVEQQPELKDAVTKLTRDYDLIRIIVKDIEELRENENLCPAVLQRFQVQIIVNEIHSREEEPLLFQ